MPVAAIYLYDQCYASSVSGFADVMQVANAHLAAQGSAEQYSWSFISAARQVTASNGLPLKSRRAEADERSTSSTSPRATTRATTASAPSSTGNARSGWCASGRWVPS